MNDYYNDNICLIRQDVLNYINLQEISLMNPPDALGDASLDSITECESLEHRGAASDFARAC